MKPFHALFRRYRWTALLFVLACTGTSAACAGTPPVRAEVAQRACTAIAGNAGAASGPPVFLASYPADTRPHAAPFRTAAFTYDNALAVIALVACDRLPQAKRIGAALRAGALTGTRLRNAYRAGPVTGNPLANGWWDPQAKRWLEDAYQQGTATGNAAWTGLAFMALYTATGDAQWRNAAVHLGQWIATHAASAQGAPGYTGGIDGFDTDPHKLAWKSTEQNIDAEALFTWLAKGAHGAEWRAAARSARAFVASQWDAANGHFRIGTLPGGHENTSGSGLDVQMWSQLLPHAPANWQRAVPYAEAHFAVSGGFAFSTNRDGLWLEGTAQAALTYDILDTSAKADALFASINGQFAPDGYVYATREPSIQTVLVRTPGGAPSGFYYYRQPHLGATAWAALAARNWNPFIAHPRQRRQRISTPGRQVDLRPEARAQQGND